MNYKEFSSKIKSKYPDYADMDDMELAKKMVAKFPDYNDVTFDDSAATSPQLAATSEPEKYTKDWLGPQIEKRKQEGYEAFQKGDMSAGLTAPIKMLGDFAGTATGTVSRAFEPVTKPIGKALAQITPEPIKRGLGKAVEFGAEQYKKIVPEESRELVGSMGNIAGVATLANPFKAEVAGLAKGAVKGTGKAIEGTRSGIATAISNLSDIPEEVLQEVSDPAVLQRISKIQAETGGDLFKLSEKLNNEVMQKRLSIEAAEKLIEAEKANALQSEVFKSGGRPLDVSGQKLKEKYESTRSDVGARFGTQQENILQKSGVANLPLDDGAVNAAKNEIDNLIIKYNFDPVKGYGYIGNKTIPAKAFEFVSSLKDEAGSQKTVGDLLRFRRNIDNKINFDKDLSELFSKGSESDLLLTDLRNSYNKVITDKISSLGQDGETLARMWEYNNKAYHNATETLNDLKNGVGLNKIPDEKIVEKINSMGSNRLNKIKKFAESDPAGRDIWEEVKTGFKDDLFNKSITQNGLDYNKLSKTWNSIDPAVKKEIYDIDEINTINAAIERYKPEQLKGSSFGEGVVGKTIDSDKTARRLENIGSKNYRGDLAELQMIDDILGSNYASTAKDVYLAKSLKMTPEGKLSSAPISRTGKSTKGPVVGAGIGAGIGASVAGPVGAAIGSALGGVAGGAVQSPKLAVPLYKAFKSKQKVKLAQPITKPEDFLIGKNR